MLLRFNSEDLFSLKVKDIQPPSAKFIPIGTRVCAHWSPQYRCFYPGTVTEGRFLMPSCNFFFQKKPISAQSVSALHSVRDSSSFPTAGVTILSRRLHRALLRVPPWDAEM